MAQTVEFPFAWRLFLVHLILHHVISWDFFRYQMFIYVCGYLNCFKIPVLCILHTHTHTLFPTCFVFGPNLFEKKVLTPNSLIRSWCSSQNSQWWIQDFPWWGGCVNFRDLCTNLWFGKIFPRELYENKRDWTKGAEARGPFPLNPSLVVSSPHYSKSENVTYYIQFLGQGFSI